MSQTFTLHVATDTIANDAQQIGVTADDLSRISIQVTAEIVQQPALYLQLTYQVTLPTPSLAAKLNWPMWQPEHIGFADYLWEETCLECFITGDLVKDEEDQTKTTGTYVEINANPDGHYALYRFESYRTPATLPPSPFYDADGRTRVSIHWSDEPIARQRLSDDALLSYERRFGIPLRELPNQQYTLNSTEIGYIHPCVILKFDETALYFAPHHASPPDFHNRHYWSRFEG